METKVFSGAESSTDSFLPALGYRMMASGTSLPWSKMTSPATAQDAIKPLSDVDAASETNTAATTSLHTEALEPLAPHL